jgi:hypothetical protein
VVGPEAKSAAQGTLREAKVWWRTGGSFGGTVIVPSIEEKGRPESRSLRFPQRMKNPGEQ